MSSERATKAVHLSLSGGGFRASFFHLGALYALAEQGVLSRLELMVSVSGGSIAASMYFSAVDHLVRTSDSGQIDYSDAVVRAFRELIWCSRSSPRHRAIGSFRALSRSLVYNEFGTSYAMERQYAKWLVAGITEPSEHSAHLPEWRIAASDCITGRRVQLVFNDRHVGRSNDAIYCNIGRESIPKAISASTAVPVLFEPVTWKVEGCKALRLSDGGVLDNQGGRELNPEIAECICIDASARLSPVHSISGWQTSLRAMDMLMEQARIDSIPEKIDLYQLRQPKGVSPRPDWWQDLMDLRTDLDNFNLLEIDLLFLAG